MMRRMEKYSAYANEMTANKYKEYEARPEKDFTYLSEISVKYCLLPVWFITVEFGGKKHHFAVNGQTGEASGRIPTSSGADLYDTIISKTGESMVLTIPIYIMAIQGFILGMLTLNFSASVTTMKTAAVVFFTVSEIVLIILYLLLLLFRALHKSLSSRKGKTAYDINDYDRMPDLENYFDPLRKSEIKISEIPLHYAQLLTNDDGNIFGGNSLKL
jgi:hypothetical protein